MTTTRRILALAAAATLIAVGCSDDDDSSDSTIDTAAPTSAAPATDAPATDPPATDAPPSTDPPATDAPPATQPPATDAPPSTDPPALPDTPIVAAISQTYDFEGGDPDPADLPAAPGSVEAHWYTSGDVMAVVFVGLDPEANACPGNSIRTATGFEFVSNGPLPNGICDDFSTLIENTSSQGVQLCDGRVGYLTLIPAGTSGELYSSIERSDPDVTGVGLTGFVALPDPSVLPDIEASLLAC